jgi:hypothetical protein
MYVCQLLSKENWSKSPDSDERVYRAGNFLKILGFFHFLPQIYSDLSFLAKLLLGYVEQILNQRFGLNVQTPIRRTSPQCRKFFVESYFFFDFLPQNYADHNIICLTNFILQVMNQRLG